MLRVLTLLLIIAIAGCENSQSTTLGPAPEIRFVQDTENSFHLRWDEPIHDERTVLVKVTHFWQSAESESVPIIFAPGEVRSDRVWMFDNMFSSMRSSYTLEILDANECKKLKRPIRGIKADRMSSKYGGLSLFHRSEHDTITIQKQYPFNQEYVIKPYKIGTPSKLGFVKLPPNPPLRFGYLQFPNMKQCLIEYQKRKAYISHPVGFSTSDDLWLPEHGELRECCRLQIPSDDFRLSVQRLQQHCRSLKHCATLFECDEQLVLEYWGRIQRDEYPNPLEE